MTRSVILFLFVALVSLALIGVYANVQATESQTDQIELEAQDQEEIAIALPYKIEINRKLKQTGLHGKLQTRISISCTEHGHETNHETSDENSCHFPKEIILFERFSKHIFLDRFELSEIERIIGIFNVLSFEEDGMDVEKPSYRMENDHYAVLRLHVDKCLVNKTSDKSSASHVKSWELYYEIPVHFRYQAPRMHLEHIEVPLPETPEAVIAIHSKTPSTMPQFQKVTEENFSKIIETIKGDVFNNSFTVVTLSKSPHPPQDLIAHVPIGRIEHQHIVSPITLLVSTCGAIILSIATIIYMRRTD